MPAAGYEEGTPLVKVTQCSPINGFNRHARVGVATFARDLMMQLIKYVPRPPISNERLNMKEKMAMKLTSLDGGLGLDDFTDGTSVFAEPLGGLSYAGETPVKSDGTFSLQFPLVKNARYNFRLVKRIGVELIPDDPVDAAVAIKLPFLLLGDTQNVFIDANSNLPVLAK